MVTAKQKIKEMKQHHKIEIFTANCPLCKQVIDDIEIGKCEGCIQIVYNVNEVTEEIHKKINDYDVTAVPTIVVDGNIKVVGVPNFPWICGQDLYEKLKADYPLKK